MSKIAVLGLDGVPYTFLKKLLQEGHLPNLEKLFSQGTLRRMNSVLPTVSSVAWTSFATGQNPGGHGIYGFMEMKPGTDELYIPLSTEVKAKTIWQNLSEQGKKVIVINVPLTYPPRPVNGTMIAGFLCPEIEKVVYPKGTVPILKKMDYQIDVDASKAREGKKQEFLKDLHFALEKRFETAFYFLENAPWDYFHLHVMETDRINHFFWGETEILLDYYKKIDAYAGEFIKRLSKDTSLIILSDHGFCTIKKEVQLNYYLKEIGKEDIAYSLIPGRIYLRKKNRQYDKNRQALKKDLITLTNPEKNDKVIKAVYLKEEIYSGSQLKFAPDLVAEPEYGYDLKAKKETKQLFENTAISGMHTFDDAFIFSNAIDFPAAQLDITQIYNFISRPLCSSSP